MVALCLLTAAACVGLLVVVWFVAVPEEVRRLVHENAVLQARVVALIEEGRATEDDLAVYAKANEASWRELDGLLNGGITHPRTKDVAAEGGADGTCGEGEAEG